MQVLGHIYISERTGSGASYQSICGLGSRSSTQREGA